MMYLIPLFTVAMAIYYMQYGSYLSNIIYAVLMSLLLWNAIEGLLCTGSEKNRFLYAVTLLYCINSYAMWTASCIWEGDTLANPYFWFDFLMSICFLLYLPALRKVVEG